MRIRILPVLIVFAVLTLGQRVGEIWQGFGGIAEAGGDAAQSAELVKDPFARIQTAAADAAKKAPKPEAGMSGAESGTVERTAAADPKQDTPEDPLSMSDEEIELLQQLSERREELDKRAKQLDRREDLVKAAEKRLEDRVADLKALKKTIQDLLVEYDEQQDRQIERLVAIYEKMKPDDAARIFENLEMPVLLKVVDRMSERRTAPILAEMQPDKAQALTLELAERRELPVPRE